jgi:hypothetical protein
LSIDLAVQGDGRPGAAGDQSGNSNGAQGHFEAMIGLTLQLVYHF